MAGMGVFKGLGEGGRVGDLREGVGDMGEVKANKM